MSDPAEDEQSVRETLLPSLKLSVHAVTGVGEVRGSAGSSASEVAARAAAAVSQAPRVAEGNEADRPRGARVNDVIGGRYIVEGTIGRGGMGRVLRARHKALGKAFALKLIKVPIANSPRIRDMFYREARLASALSHDNICSVVDFGDDEQFGLFMVMELLEGQTLYKKLQFDGPFAQKVACDVIWQVGEALRYIHSRAIIHGDIKSENIYVIRTPDRRRVAKLLDFGLARAEAALRGTTGRVEGTPHYLAPERIHGDPPSQQSDIYALGILFYELLTGKLPFKGEVEDIFRAHLESPVPLVRDDVGEIEERADEIIQRATAKDPAERHPDVPGFLYELRTLMNMLGIESGRRRPSRDLTGAARRTKASERDDEAAQEVFEWAPVPLACVDAHGRVRVANGAFLEFLGVAGRAAGIELAHSALRDVYPALLDDLHDCASKRRSIKRVIYLSEGGGETVEVAVVMTPPPPSEAKVTAGEVHLALHPLARH